MIKITNIKITPDQLAEIEAHLSRASWILNAETLPDWEDTNIACREIADALDDLHRIKEKAEEHAEIIF